MNFISLEFIISLPLLLVAYWKLSERYRWILLLFVSFGFYLYWNAWSVLYLSGMTGFTFFMAKVLDQTENVRRKKIFLMLTVGSCVLFLLFFKSFGTLSGDAAFLIPVGISFYVFQTMGYVIDVYRGEIKAETHFGYYALFVSFFPQLVAGPIERASCLLPQIRGEAADAGQSGFGQVQSSRGCSEQGGFDQVQSGPCSIGHGSTGQDSIGQDSTGQDSIGQDSTGQDSTGQDSTGQDSTEQDSFGQEADKAREQAGYTLESKLEAGFVLLLRGFFKKIVIADYFAGFVDQIYGAPNLMHGPAVVLGTVLFAFQIYCDFSGYSDIAVGCAEMLGIHLMENFHNPYGSKSIREFWRRWHISLTQWFRDYVYIPLGGNRKGLALTCINTLLVFCLSGLWHGFGLTFLIWGALHGLYLVAERLFRNCNSMIWTFTRVCFAWIFFRASSMKDALLLVRALPVGWSPSGGLNPSGVLQVAIGAQAWTAELLPNTGIDIAAIIRILLSLAALAYVEKREKPLNIGYCSVMLTVILFGWLALLGADAGNSFIYFQF